LGGFGNVTMQTYVEPDESDKREAVKYANQMC